jgi:hypothetical protein
LKENTSGERKGRYKIVGDQLFFHLSYILSPGIYSAVKMGVTRIERKGKVGSLEKTSCL